MEIEGGDTNGSALPSTRSLISTQFSPIDARRAFPCIDQPDRKAIFEMTLITPLDKTMVLSNMPVETR